MATVREMAASVSAHTGTPLSKVGNLVRRLQEAGTIPAGNGPVPATARIEHLASLLLALLSDAQLKDAAAAVRTYGTLTPDGVHTDVLPDRLASAVWMSRDYVEQLLHLLATGDADDQARCAGMRLEVVSNWPEVSIGNPRSGGFVRCLSKGSLPERWQNSEVRRSVTITGLALKRIIRSLQITR